jgi:SpoVK/Ycf46/Vps4 family AAA+-type ATPase
MIKHIVLFQFKKNASSEAHKRLIKEIKKSLENLKGIIPELKYIETALNNNPNESYDLSLISEFSTWDDLKTYNLHPEHQKVLQIIRQNLLQRACVDYEF